MILTTSAAKVEDNLTFAVETSVPAAKAGDVISVTVKATKNDGFFYGIVNLEYDDALVEYVDYATTDSVFSAVEATDLGEKLLVEIGTIANRNAALDPRTFDNAVPMTAEGVVFVANFKLKADIKDDTAAKFTLTTTSRLIQGSETELGAATDVPNYNYIINGVRYINNTTVSSAKASVNVVAANHDHEKYGWTVITDADAACAHKEVTVSECKFCFEQKTVDGASLLEDVEAKAETCTEDGYTAHQVCKNCGEKVGYEVVKAGHKEEIIPAVDATCTMPGMSEGKKCSACGETLVAPTLVAILNHTEEILPAVEATWNSAGKTEGKKCSVCGTILTAQETIPATGMPVWAIIIIIVACVAIVIGAVALLLVLTKKKKA